MLGPGFLEAVYQEALEIELAARRLPFIAQHELQIAYKGRYLNATGAKVDVLINFGSTGRLEWKRMAHTKV